MKTRMHENSIEAYRKINLTAAQARVARAILNETIHGRPATMDSLFHRYGILSSSSGRITEMKTMAENGQAFILDGNEYALVCVGKQLTSGGNKADAFKLEQFAVVRQAWIEGQQARQIGVQTEMQL